MKTPENPGHTKAIVIGASMAGLMTARALSAHFDEVILLEKDPVGEGPESRKGQPQTQHLHGLLGRGFQIMKHYFPDLRQQLIEGGAIVADVGETMRWYVNGGYRSRPTLGQDGVAMSRPFLEYLIRKAVLEVSNIRLLDGCKVQQLLFSEDARRVLGVAINRSGPESQPEVLPADLVVDASGRGSLSPKWLEAQGYGRPEETTIGIDLCYATRQYKRAPAADGTRPDWMLITPATKDEKRFGGAFAIEGDRWIVMVGGLFKDHPQKEEAAYLAFARDLPAPDIYEIMKENEALTEVKLYKFPHSLRRHYERLKRFPEGLLVVGDAVCSFNPVYGQGMSVAAAEAYELDLLLQKRKGDLGGLAKPFFKRIGKLVDIPWQTAAGEDFRFPETQGKKAPGTDLINAYIQLVNRASHTDEKVCKAFLMVMNLQRPPASLFHPSILWRTLFRRRATLPQPVLEPQPAG